MTVNADPFAERVHPEEKPEPENMSDHALLVELVTGQREIIAFIEQVAKGMVEFQETAKSHPILRMLLGGNGG